MFVNILIFPSICDMLLRKIKQALKKILMSKQFGQENKNSNFKLQTSNFLHGFKFLKSETLLYMSNASYIEFTFHVTNKGISQFEERWIGDKFEWPAVV